MNKTSTQTFIQQHRLDDIRQLALQAARHPDVDMTYALTQIAGWQSARQKLPSWAQQDEIIYPPHISLEQCSSETTATYKAQLCQRLLHDYLQEQKTTTLVDLTGGFGVDFSFMAKSFDTAIYIEQQEHLCDIAQHNMPQLGLKNTKIIHGDGLEYINQLDSPTLIFADPARRDIHGRRTFAISDCTPDILAAESLLLSKAPFVVLKLSPMLDIHKTIDDLQQHHEGVVKEVHVIATGNECKELLIVLSSQCESMPKMLFCVNDQDILSVSMEEWKETNNLPIIEEEDIPTQQYLYEPHAAIMKAGCFHVLTQHHKLKALSANSHLFLSTDYQKDFPGRKFQIQTVSTFNRRELRQQLKDITHANITVRNFPMSVAELRKRLKLHEGGQYYIFATTSSHGTHLLFVCRKM